MVLVYVATIGARGGRGSAGGEVNSRQQAEAVELVTRPMICLREQRVISGVKRPNSGVVPVAELHLTDFCRNSNQDQGGQPLHKLPRLVCSQVY